MDDFDRDVHCLLGLPFDAVDMGAAVGRIGAAAADGEQCFLSTSNLNFLIGCQTDAAFRDSVIHSDLSVADGMPLVWLARLLGIPIRERVAGSGLFETLWQRHGDKPLSVYLFGGPEGAAARASEVLNAQPCGLGCAGFDSPGFGSLEDMSGMETIARINASGADFLVVALGARKGQAWIERNRDRITVPVISHLGAVVNFVAGTVSRAPRWMQRTGLEWLWRIKEELALWRRYWNDGTALIGLLLTRVLPYAAWQRLAGGAGAGQGCELRRVPCAAGNSVRIAVSGSVPAAVPEQVRTGLREAAAAGCDVVIDLEQAGQLSPAFFGLLLMLRKKLDFGGYVLGIEGAERSLRRLFRWNGVEYLLAERV